MNLISIVVPVYNEAANIKNLFLEICSVLEKLSKDYKFEIIFVNDGSQDESGNIIRSLEKTFIQIKLIEFTRNFSKEVALSAGLQAAAGSSVILMDADFQHPPELLPHFISEWEGGAEVVIGVRDYQKNIFSVRGFFSSLFNDVMRRLSQLNFREGETDFRLLDNRVVKEFCRFTERRRITRGLLNWLGFRHKYIIFSVPERRGGTSAYTMGKLFKLAIDAFFSYSLLPLRLAGYIGGVITLLSGTLGLFVFIEMIVLSDPLGAKITGTAMLAVLILFLVGIILVCLGIISYYISSIQDEVFGRPLYVVRDVFEL
jgi:dolichol-phosphate mannosyltransferase